MKSTQSCKSKAPTDMTSSLSASTNGAKKHLPKRVFCVLRGTILHEATWNFSVFNRFVLDILRTFNWRIFPCLKQFAVSIINPSDSFHIKSTGFFSNLQHSVSTILQCKYYCTGLYKCYCKPKFLFNLHTESLYALT